MIKVAIIDDNPTSRKKLDKPLKKDPDIHVVAETGLVGIKEIEEKKPDVILLDNKKPFTDCLETTKTIVGKLESTKIIVLSMDSKPNITASECLVGACFPFARTVVPRTSLLQSGRVTDPIGEPDMLRIAKQSRLNDR